MANEEIRNVASKLIVGVSDPTFSPISPPYSGTSVASWGVFGLPTGAVVGIGSTDTKKFVPRAVVQIGPACPPPPQLTPGFIPLPNVSNVLEINGNTLVTANDTQSGNVFAWGEVISNQGEHVLSAKKNFDIPHPTKEGWRLSHCCIEGPEAAVYVRGRVKGETEIKLPDYWKKLVDVETISVNLTPIGSHQEVFVQRWDSEKIYLYTNSGMTIDCFYHVYAERIDTEKLIPEYEGTIEDYPGDNSQRSIVGYHYDNKESN